MNESTLLLAKMMSPYLFVTGLGFFLSKAFYIRMLNEVDKAHPVTINLSGMVHFFIGIAVVLLHPLWGTALEIVVSLLGIAFMLKGVVLIAIPDIAMKSSNATVGKLPVIGVGFLSMSVYLAYASYFSV